jgi:predicted Rossmann fold nucleotide-binding protein DprA/Smf involved in DNA uptake
MIYAGIGSRETPPDVQKLIFDIADKLAKKGYVLRSGGADGADLTFEAGCDNSNGLKEIFLPW